MTKKEGKYRCKLCKQIIKPNPDGSCPVCGAPKGMIIVVRDSDDNMEPYKRR